MTKLVYSAALAVVPLKWASTGHAMHEIVDEITLCARASGLETKRVRDLAGFAREQDRSLVEVLVERGGVREQDLVTKLAELMGLSCLTSQKGSIPGNVLESMSPSLAIAHHVMPIEKCNGRMSVACWNPFDWQSWDELAYILGVRLEKVLCPRPVIERMLNTYYGIGADTVERLVANHTDKAVQVKGETSTDLSEEEAANEPTVINLVNKILTEAIRSNATDIHFEPYENKYRVRYRIDGMLEDVSVPASVNMLKQALISRIKIMSGLDITEKRLPQDGRCQVSLGGQDYDLRVSILPGIHGGGVVIRLQNRQMVKLDLGTLGFGQEEEQRITTLVGRPYGLILVTGPTGSGKTTTLYACLNRIISPTTKIVTVEDPVEYWMDDILQMQVHEEIGFDFARALRGILRHDPDIVLVGEIRDRETADIAVRASLTGHLVFATLHTNDASSAATRLIDIGIEPFLTGSSVQGILAQRLVRTVCQHCKSQVDPASLNDLQRRILESEGGARDVVLWEGRGCEKCRFTGYRGRTAVGEVLMFSPAVKALVQEKRPAEQIKIMACQEGMRTLRDSAVSALRAGRTTIAEVLRVTQEDF